VACALVAKHVEFNFVKKNYFNVRASSVIIFMVALMDDPTPIIYFLIEKSNLKGIKTYPAMSKRIDVLSLLYRCMNSGVSILPEFRKKVYRHIAESQFEISKIYRDAKTFPIAKLEDDGVSHTFFYIGKVRKTLGDALISYRKLANEILLSPNESYAETAIEVLDETKDFDRPTINFCVNGCLVVPLVGVIPEKVLSRLYNLRDSMSDESVFYKIAESTIEKVKKVYLE